MTPPRHERMSAEFEKFHLGDGRVLHRFTGPDRGGAHDHPFAIEVEVLSGGYVERIYRHPESGWTHEDVERRPGDRFTIPAERIHEIVALSTGECWTIASYGPHERETRFWRWRDGVAQSRAWHEGWAEDE